MNYREFLESKFDVQPRSGFDVDLNDIHPALKPHQAVSVRWALSGGRRLVAASFGLGKTIEQCEIARQVHIKTDKKFLQICPLGVRHQFFTEDGPKVGVQWEYCRNDAEIQAAKTPYILTNYERVRDGNITPANHDFAGVSLDEGSTLRSLGSKTYQVFTDLMASIPYRFVATATPAPNEYRELNNYAEFLGITDRGLILNKYFKRNSSKAGDLQLIESQEQKYWLWVSTWALFLYTPGDLGYSNDGYDLPEMDIRWHRLDVDHTRAWGQTDNRNQYRLLLDAASGVREASAEKRATMPERIAQAMKMLEADISGGQWII